MHNPDTNETSNNMSADRLASALDERTRTLSAAMDKSLERGRCHLILMVGLPYSGKSTYARATGHPVVSPDAIRLALTGLRYRKESEPMVWSMAKMMVAALFLAGHPTVVVDACNGTNKRRDDWKDGRWDTTHVLMQTSLEECMKRAVTAADDVIIPVIDSMADRFEWDGWAP